ncbi:MAG: hypothetical protein FJ267_18210 [Planctomycetes bacterium]|nr:hypothetical protein [Planctomycetota bacterium]
MSEQNPSRTANVERIKLAMIPLLACCLWYFLSPTKSDSTSATLSPHVTSTPTLALKRTETHSLTQSFETCPTNSNNMSNSGSEAKESPDLEKRLVNWPSISVTEIVRHNPFECPLVLKPIVPKIEQTPLEVPDDTSEDELPRYAEEVREALDGKRLTALVQTPKGLVALIGDDVVRTGDRVGERLRVAAIREKGVILELIDRSAGRSNRVDLTKPVQVEIPVTP